MIPDTKKDGVNMLYNKKIMKDCTLMKPSCM